MESEKPENSFEVAFSELSESFSKDEGPFDEAGFQARLDKFFTFFLSTSFWVPVRSLANHGLESVEVSLDQKVQLYAYLHQGQLVVPCFSSNRFFELWSQPAKSMGSAIPFLKITGRQFLQLVPMGGAAVLNPSSQRFSKWIQADEVAKWKAKK